MSSEKRSVLRDAWRLTWPYWKSEEKWGAWGLLAVVVALNLASVYISVRINLWRNVFYNALQALDEKAFFHQLLIFAILAGLAIAFGVYQLYLQQMLQIRWRRWLTRRYLDGWLGDRAYYRMQIEGGGTDNPDQRISDDLNLFTQMSLSLSVGGMGFLNAGVTLVSFLAILWSLSGSITVPLGGWGSVTVPGYLLWCAFVYAVGGTWLTFKFGRPLVGLNFNQQRFEADFRFSLVRLRENTESIALYRGEPKERGVFLERFTSVVDNFWSIMKRVKLLNWYTSGYTQFAIIFPYIVAAPRFFSKQIQLGGLMQTADAFGQVQTSLSFIVNSYTDIAQWQSVVQRLTSFDERMRQIAAEARAPQQIAVERDGAGVAVTDLALDLPDGTALLRGVRLKVAPGEALLVTGPTGAGKSTLLRAVAGIWPFGRGRIRLGEGATLFMPQRPYLPLGTLRAALLYPHEEARVPDAELAEALRQVGLAALVPELDTGSNWQRRLSLGEQQRLAFARILLTKPAILFLDEATSALDEPAEARLYRLLRDAPWRPTIVSVGHRSTLNAFHDDVCDVGAFIERRPEMVQVAE